MAFDILTDLKFEGPEKSLLKKLTAVIVATFPNKDSAKTSCIINDLKTGDPLYTIEYNGPK